MLINKTTVQVLALIASALFVYGASLQNQYVLLDDTNYVLYTDLVTSFSIDRLPELFESVRGNFTPVTWLTYIVGYSLFGGDPLGHHAINLLIHLGNVVLLFFLCRGLLTAGLEDKFSPDTTRWLPFAVGLLFSVHPQNVEAVAWIAARKDLLMCFLVLLSVISFLRYLRSLLAYDYALSIAFFILASLAKPTAVMWFAVIFLLGVWQADKQKKLASQLKHALAISVPFAACGLVIAWLAYAAQMSAGAVDPAGGLPWSERYIVVLNNLYSYFTRYFLVGDFYLNYPVNKHSGVSTFVAGLVLAVLAVSIMWSRFRFWAMLWMLTILLLLPGAGIVQVGLHATADRFAYSAFIPMHLCMIGAVGILMQLVPTLRLARIVQGAVAVLFLILGGLSFVQAATWRNDMSLWVHGVTVQPDNPIAWQYLGNAFFRRAEYSRALEGYERTVQLLKPGDYIDSRALYFGLGVASFETGETEVSFQWFEKLLADDDGSFDRLGYAHYYLAEIWMLRGQREAATKNLRISLNMLPDYERALRFAEEHNLKIVTSP